MTVLKVEAHGEGEHWELRFEPERDCEDARVFGYAGHRSVGGLGYRITVTPPNEERDFFVNFEQAPQA